MVTNDMRLATLNLESRGLSEETCWCKQYGVVVSFVGPSSSINTTNDVHCAHVRKYNVLQNRGGKVRILQTCHVHDIFHSPHLFCPLIPNPEQITVKAVERITQTESPQT